MKKLKLGTKIIIITAILFLIYKTYNQDDYLINNHPTNNNIKNILELIINISFIIGWVLVLTPLYDLYEEAIKQYERKKKKLRNKKLYNKFIESNINKHYCNDCHNIFNNLNNSHNCPICNSKNWMSFRDILDMHLIKNEIKKK